MLYRVNELRTELVTVYIDVNLVIGDKPEFIDIINWIKKYYETQ